MFTIANRYIAKLFLSYFFAGLTVFTTIFFIVDFMSTMAQYQTPLETLAAYYGYSLPSVIYQIIPMAALLATIFTLTQLQKSNELTALFSAGMSLARVSSPILILVAIISSSTFFASDLLLPIFAQKKNFVYFVEITGQPGLYSTVRQNKIWYRSNHILFNIMTLNAEKKQAQEITLYYFDPNWNLIQLISAAEAQISGHRWNLTNGAITLFLEGESFPVMTKFRRKTISLNEDITDVQSNPTASEVMSLDDLKKFINKNKEAGLDTVQYEVDYHSKFSMALTPLILTLLGIPFSLGGPRGGGRALSIGKCIGIAFIYWAALSSSLTLGRHGVLIPSISAWAPNVIMGVIATLFLLRIKR